MTRNLVFVQIKILEVKLIDKRYKSVLERGNPTSLKDFKAFLKQ
jgi:hypothetical protein